MLIKNIVRKTLGIKSHMVKTVTQDGDGLTVCLNIHKHRRLPCSACGRPGRVQDRLAVRT